MTLLALGLTAMVILLAVMQWRWLSELEGHEHYRRARRVGYASWLFKEIFERELTQLARSMVVPVTGREATAAEISGRLERWRATTRWPGLVGAVYVVGTEGRGEPALLELVLLASGAGQLEPAAWPATLRPIAPALRDALHGWRLAPPRDFHFLSEEPALLIPWPDSPDRALLLSLDRRQLAETVFPEIVELVFPPPSFTAIEVAVISARSRAVFFSTLDGERGADFGAADVLYGLVPQGASPADFSVPMDLRPGTEGPRPDESLVIPSSERPPTLTDEEWFGGLWSHLFYTGHWQLLVRNGDVPVVEEVAAIRRRKITAAFGLLALLSISIAVLTVGARRTQRAAREQMEQLARVSHELRTPLSVLSSAGDNLADALVSDEGQLRRYGEVIQKETRRLHEMVENVLHISRRRARAPEMEPQRVDLVALLEDCLESADPSLRQEGFTVERSLPEQPVAVLAEPRALRSAVLNLISNAIKYGKPARWLRLAVEQDSGSEVRIVVEDRGPGISKGELRRLFKPYARGKRAVHDQTEGSGLGLAVVKEIVEAHAGRVTVRSPVVTATSEAPTAGGTAFILHLPRSDAG